MTLTGGWVQLSLQLKLTLTLFLIKAVVCYANSNDNGKKRIAVIGGGISGTFFTKYLTDYDVHDSSCMLESITVFDPYAVNPPTNEDTTYPKVSPQHTSLTPDGTKGQQGSRVSSVTLSDGTIVELGASIIFGGNQLTTEMIGGDDELEMKPPFFPGYTKQAQEQKEDNIWPKLPTGMGIYDYSDQHHLWSLITSNSTRVAQKLLWKYNLDLYRVNRATDRALPLFNQIYNLLADEESIFDSPDEIWKRVGLLPLTRISLDDYLDSIGVSTSTSWWKDAISYLTGFEKMGQVREELLDSMNICNNNKVNDEMTALAGLFNFLASKGDLFSIEGGNSRLLESALKQASRQEDEICGGSRINHVQQRIKTVMSDVHDGLFELFGTDNKSLGKFDYVILAAPLQFANINFLVRGSMFDGDVLHPMPLNGMVDADSMDANDHAHRSAIGLHLPESTSRRYTQVVTTVVSNGELNTSHIGFPSETPAPRSILFSKRGRDKMNLSGVTKVTRDGIFKIFSTGTLDAEQIELVFGKSARIEYVKEWGDTNGGATPDFNGGKGTSSVSAQFLLYDGGHDVGGDGDNSHALYYVSAMESAVSAIEISAIGAKSIAKHLAVRLGLLTLHHSEKEEL